MTGLHAEDVGQEIIPLSCHLKKGTQENGEQAIHDALLNLFFFFAVLHLLPGNGRRSLVGCSPWGRLELDTTE